MSETTAETTKPVWPGLVFLATVILGLGVAGWQLLDWLEDEQQAPVQRILLSGERQYIDDQQVIAQIRQQLPGSFFALDVQQVHSLLEQRPWIYRASVRKQWPNTLKIYVVEQQPVVSWNGDMLLNQYGESFQASLAQVKLPRLFGPGGSEKTALQGYRAMQSLLSHVELGISELMLSERFAWQLRLSNGVQLNLGRTEFIDRLQRFIDIYPLLKQQVKALDYVDLRYDTGAAVGWKDRALKQRAIEGESI